MNAFVSIILVATVGLAVGAAVERVRLHKFWRRTCMGFAWRRRFPNVSKKKIRDFLRLVVDAFAFSRSRALKFSPDDRLIEIYEAIYPVPRLTGDAMELEGLIESIETQFGVDLRPHWRKDITHGELFAAATNA